MIDDLINRSIEIANSSQEEIIRRVLALINSQPLYPYIAIKRLFPLPSDIDYVVEALEKEHYEISYLLSEAKSEYKALLRKRRVYSINYDEYHEERRRLLDLIKQHELSKKECWNRLRAAYDTRHRPKKLKEAREYLQSLSSPKGGWYMD